ncbi:anti-sigma factor family protein [Alicyclobacillus sp. ALC3]|uniref:anti-sigma factor family protein n=1 Tax=Alicyclobacillus sp. ALC3 TaxID=2796143 RepID=UPI002379DF38|nr:zf-HC2 domain-containing protein [Alicyclobacillus sp. ALC3]WDL96286.1 zf-HC2 domain-containing protein [Alicyclobacillus sp. ALC3]
MMTRVCTHCLSYVLGELPDLDKKRFERHLKHCEPCQNEVKELNALHQQTVADFSKPTERRIRPSLWVRSSARVKAMGRVSLAALVTVAAMASFTMLTPVNRGSDIIFDIKHTPTHLKEVVDPLKVGLTRAQIVAVSDIHNLERRLKRSPHRI